MLEMIRWRIFSVILSFFILVLATPTVPKLLIISFDGFRHDYLSRNITPNLNLFRTIGASSNIVQSVFPSQTFPGHFSIATGLYPEAHGVLASSVFDVSAKKVLDYGYELFHYNDGIVPIWTLNQLAGRGRYSGVMMWPGSDFKYVQNSPTFVQPFNEKLKWEDRVDIVIGWFKHNKTPANLAMMYFEEPDMASHAFGPNSAQTNVQIGRVDKIMKLITDKLKLNNINDINVILLSDHGMEEVQINNIIHLEPAIGNMAYMYGTSPVLQIYPKNGVSEEAVLSKLLTLAKTSKTFNVYKKSDIPSHFHYKNCKRAPPILAVAEPSYAFQDLLSGIECYKRQNSVSGKGPFGVHGYDPKVLNMSPFFTAYGPRIKANYKSTKSFEIIDLYSLFARILELDLPKIKPNGSISNVAHILK